MTLLLGPPQSGKSTVLKALSGRLHPSGLKIQGNVSNTAARDMRLTLPQLPPCPPSTSTS